MPQIRAHNPCHSFCHRVFRSLLDPLTKDFKTISDFPDDYWISGEIDGLRFAGHLMRTTDHRLLLDLHPMQNGSALANITLVGGIDVWEMLWETKTPA